MKNIREIKQRIASLKETLHREYGVSKLEFFGSYVRGEQREDSDIDVLVEFDRDVSLLDIAKLQIFLSEQLGIKTDVVHKNCVREELKDVIFAEAVPI
jgi:predicted nucleotidyltransferase